MVFGYYSRIDRSKEIICRTISLSRLKAAECFAARKQLDLKSFLKIYAVKNIV
jgi:hypothetical protein